MKWIKYIQYYLATVNNRFVFVSQRDRKSGGIIEQL